MSDGRKLEDGVVSAKRARTEDKNVRTYGYGGQGFNQRWGERRALAGTNEAHTNNTYKHTNVRQKPTPTQTRA